MAKNGKTGRRQSDTEDRRVDRPEVPGGKKDGGDEDESSHRGACPQVDRTGFGRGEWMDGRDRPNERLMRGALRMSYRILGPPL